MNTYPPRALIVLLILAAVLSALGAALASWAAAGQAVNGEGAVPLAPDIYYFHDSGGNVYLYNLKLSGNDFTVFLPGSYGYYERSWSTDYTGGYYGTCFVLNGTQIGCAGAADGIAYGGLSGAQLLPDRTHNIEISSNGYGGLALLYRVP